MLAQEILENKKMKKKFPWGKTIEHIFYTKISYLLYINVNKTKSRAESAMCSYCMEINSKKSMYSMMGIMKPSKFLVENNLQNREQRHESKTPRWYWRNNLPSKVNRKQLSP